MNPFIIENIFSTYGKIGVEVLKNSISSLRATGETERSLGYRIEKEKDSISLILFGREYFRALETGRGPAKGNDSNGEFPKRLEEYMNAKGFPSKVSKKGIKYFKIGENWYSGKSLAYMINKRGDKTYRDGGRILFSDDLSKFIEELKSVLIEELGKEIKMSVSKITTFQ